MIEAVAIAVAYLIGSLPTAGMVGRLAGVDLRSSGTGNPGTANALGLAGKGAALSILALELGKGSVAVLLGRAAGGDLVGVLAGIAAIVGNLFNVWYRFRGGKGLGISGGVVVAAWPGGFFPLMVVIAVAARVLRSASRATLVALGGFLVLGLTWAGLDWPALWGIQAGGPLVLLAVALPALLAPRFVLDLAGERRRSNVQAGS